MVFQNKQFDPMQIANAAADFTVEFNDANMTVVTSATVTQPVEAWCPPPAGILKLNVDAGCFNDGRMGCGMVVRDNGGNVKFAATMLDNIRVSSTMAEVIALRWGLHWILSSDQNGH